MNRSTSLSVFFSIAATLLPLYRKAYLIALSVCTVLLLGDASPVEAQQEAALSVRQFELDSIESVGKAMADGCTKSHPQLKTAFDEAVVSFRRRAGAVIDALLATERFRHLATATVPRRLIENSAVNQQSLRKEALNAPEAQCKQAISVMAVSDEQLRTMLSEVLESFDRCRVTSSCIGP